MFSMVFDLMFDVAMTLMEGQASAIKITSMTPRFASDAEIRRLRIPRPVEYIF